MLIDYFLGDWRDKIGDLSYEKFVEAMAIYDDSLSTFATPSPVSSTFATPSPISTFAAPSPVAMKR